MTMQDTLPQGLVMCHPTMDDTEAALEVIKAHQMAVCGESEKRLEDVQGWWSSNELAFPENAWLVEQPDFDALLWFIAMDGEQIAGISLCEHQHGIGDYVGSLGVRRPWRKQGLGQALLLHSFGEFYHRGIKKVSLNVDGESLTGATRLYESVGMHVVRQQYRYEKEMRPGRGLSTQSI